MTYYDSFRSISTLLTNVSLLGVLLLGSLKHSLTGMNDGEALSLVASRPKVFNQVLKKYQEEKGYIKQISRGSGRTQLEKQAAQRGKVLEQDAAMRAKVGMKQTNLKAEVIVHRVSALPVGGLLGQPTSGSATAAVAATAAVSSTAATTGSALQT